MKKILVILLFAAITCLSAQQLYINEFMADNDNIIADEQGDFDDWVEIYNPNAEAVDLGGFFISDSEDELDQYEIPTDSPEITTIAAGGFLLIWCDDDDADGALHTNFKLSADGEGIFLTEWNGAVITDSYSFGAQTTDVSEGRIADGDPQWQFFASPTPGESNAGNNQPPLITNWQQMNLLPAAEEDVQIIATVTDDDLDEVLINYQTAAGWAETQMYDDGAHNDGEAGDDIYGGAIPGFAANTMVSYYLEAIDEDEASSIFPLNAPDVMIEYENGWQHPQLYINEFMASNETTIADPQGDYEDWIEIYNAGSEPVDLAGYYFTDDFSNLSSWHQIPSSSPDSTTIQPGQFLLLWADDDSNDGILHLNFKLSGDGENFGFYAYYATTPVDSLSYQPLENDISQGRLPDGSENWDFFGPGLENPATPGAANLPSPALPDQIIPAAGISAVYPNPFLLNSQRSSLQIDYFALNQTDIKLNLFNLKGQKLSDTSFCDLQPGTNKITWNLPENLPAGIYFIQSNTPGNSGTRKLLLIK